MDIKERRKELVTRWLAGETQRQIAKVLGVTVSQVGWMVNNLRRRGVALPKRRRVAALDPGELSNLQKLARESLAHKRRADAKAAAAPDSAGQ